MAAIVRGYDPTMPNPPFTDEVKGGRVAFDARAG
jgi:hypothetical protein